MRNWRPFLVILLFCSVACLFACQRTEKAQAGKAPSGVHEPEYTVGAQVATVPGTSHVAGLIAVAGQIDGGALYAAHCAACHQQNGQGVPGAFPPLDGSPYVTGDNTERLAAIMIYGLTGPIKVKGVQYTNVMLPLGKTLKDEELAAIATHIRSTWSNQAPAVEAAVFTKTREKYGERAQFNIQELGEDPA